ncbi:PREDICTED: CD82 antigen-like [Poecilia mexicana]|uniref:Tetraspanin n=1 Tax=Poecilia mexicana TaxID=48701 RepID=A0A3B3Y8M9_9TELE|nr:PREDICTED: CD82 antigen-like [Poecilia mexicana]
MGKVNVWLKRSYVCTIGVIAGTAVFTLGIALFGHGIILHEEDDHALMGIYFFYGFSVITLLFAVIGGFGVWKEKKWALIVFAVGMILGCLFFIFLEISLPFAQKELELSLKNNYLSMLPLSNVSESELSEFNHTQSEFRCCGITSHEDWENNIPESCQCDIDSSDDCIDTYGPMHNDSGLNVLDVKPIRIFAKPCIQVLIQFEMRYFSTLLGIMLAKTLLWILSVGLCIAILCQLNKKVETPNVVYSREAKAGNYDILSDAQEPSLKTE